MLQRLNKLLILLLVIATFLTSAEALNASSKASVQLAAITDSSGSLNQADKAKSAKKRRTDSLSWIKLQQRYPSAYYLNGPRHKKEAALTFDDAPDPRFTPTILDILAKHHVQATFFLVGTRANKHPEIVKRIHREGHIIGNHSYNHEVMSKLSPKDFHRQVWHTDAIISRIIPYHPHFFRPPYGEMLPGQVAWTKKNGYIVVNWDVDSADWKNNPSSAVILRNMQKTLRPGSIILQHAGGGVTQSLSGTIEALPQLIASLQQKGYRIVTLPELLGQSAERRIR
ncbi:Peptidoglycan/xylan/chitin deacetylase, PgdA/CDA1 family [Paenibacillus algorifonticola]|uniref:Peptidoglycan/xylan/chitin deacetylase, PgdA/CDA1 family n=1 Tax=Paenibacillus algorifonticola TaxID=684063 RepID=A0A1I2HKF2_9BACL|nr:polysaccharide deacetylase family protein [Paenibacillus algorifonticola]SFF30209.1 Peptidoglycan/xylan/chitin deacetylase, PgdA/CDA1 family [Paenibacillus algorifonticola]